MTDPIPGALPLGRRRKARPNGSAPGIGSVMDGGHVAGEAGQGWAGRNRIWICVTQQS
jgi:hypothetical protein